MVGRLAWTDMNPSSLTNVESVARRLRYRHLALTAQRHNVTHLFTGHHRDDQIETTLMRLIRAARPSLLGLQGMASSSPVPCCEDIRGVRNQEPPALFSDNSKATRLPVRRMESPSEHERSDSLDLEPLMAGGIKLHRPLLAFGKSDLTAVCESSAVPYVIDNTNADPTFTMRNAVRVLRSQHKLPAALQDSSILNLVEKARDTAADIRQRATKFLQGVKITRMDLHSGTFDISIPKSLIQLRRLDRLAAANVVSRLCSLVSGPSENSTLAPATVLTQMTYIMRGNVPPVFTYSATQFRAAYVPRKDDTSVVWKLSRTAPLRRSPISSFLENSTSAETEGRHHSKSLLWDGRYWVRLRASHSILISTVCIRFFNAKLPKTIAGTMSSTESLRLRALLRQHAPGDTRYTLPVLAINDQIIAFPTISSEILATATFQKQTESLGLQDAWLQWEVNYKVFSEDLSIWGTETQDASTSSSSSSTDSPSPERHQDPPP